jgi:hypothetical protein
MRITVNRINEFGLEPGTYKHYKGGLYVVTDIVTHMENPTNNKMAALADPLVIYRDVVAVVKHVNGKNQTAHQVYARTLSDFTATIQHDNKSIKRFTHV